MMFHKLSQSRFLHVLPWDRFLSVLDQSGLQEARSYSTRDIKKLASYKIGKYFLSGNYFKAGENFQVYLTIQDSRTGKVIDYLTKECQGEAGIPGLIDRLSPEIKAALDLSEAKIAVDLDRSLGEMSTSSPEALKLFCEGTKLYLKGGAYYNKAIEKLKLAVVADPDFAMAYRQLAALYWNRGRSKEWSESWQKAMALKDRVSEREMLFLEGQDYQWKGEHENAVEVLTKLLERWPEDLMGHRLIGLSYASLGESEITLNHLEKANRLWPESVPDCTNLANSYFSREEYRKAEKILLAYLDDFSDSSSIRYFLSECYCLTSDFDLALQELEAAERLRPDNYYSGRKRMIYFLKGDLAAFYEMVDKQLASTSIGAQLRGRYNVIRMHYMHGRFSEAKSLAMERLSLAEEKKMRGALPELHLTLADVFLLVGDFQAALDESNEALRTAVENNNMGIRRWALVWKGRALLALNFLDEARKTAEELALTLKNIKNERGLKIQYLLEGLIERESGNLNRAVELLEKAESCLSWHLGNMDNILYLESLAGAYFRSGKLLSAKAKFEKIYSRGFLKYEYPEIWVRSFYWLGRIAEERGKKAEARKMYQEFLELWKDADPGLPEVEDTKKRLAGL
jgi:tetratricopeptide (TPR) repeat protein